MDQFTIFLSWSGDRSKAIARLLKQWLPDVLRKNCETWMSEEDIRKGSLWHESLRRALTSTKAGIIVVTPENMHNEWVMFEAGAVWKALPDTPCYTILCDVESASVTGPLSSFQHTDLRNPTDMQRLIEAINDSRGESAASSADIRRWFEKDWDDFSEACGNALSAILSPPPPVRRKLEDILDEILQLTRGIDRRTSVSTGFPITEEDIRSGKYRIEAVASGVRTVFGQPPRPPPPKRPPPPAHPRPAPREEGPPK